MLDFFFQRSLIYLLGYLMCKLLIPALVVHSQGVRPLDRVMKQG